MSSSALGPLENIWDRAKGTNNGHFIRTFVYDDPGYEAFIKSNKHLPFYAMLSRVKTVFVMRQPDRFQLIEIRNGWDWDSVVAKSEIEIGHYMEYAENQKNRLYELIDNSEADKKLKGMLVGQVLKKKVTPVTITADDFKTGEKDGKKTKDWFDSKLVLAVQKRRIYAHHVDIPFADDLKSTFNMFNPTNLINPMSISLMKQLFPGLNGPYLYISDELTTAPPHLEDHGCASFNLQIQGDTKVVFVIHEESKTRFEKKLAELWKVPENERSCRAFMQKRRGMIPLSVVDDWGVSWGIILMQPGDAVFFGTKCYHWVINLGRSINMASNCISPKFWTSLPRKCVPEDCPFADTDNQHQSNPWLSNELHSLRDEWDRYKVREDLIDFSRIFDKMNEAKEPTSVRAPTPRAQKRRRELEEEAESRDVQEPEQPQQKKPRARPGPKPFHGILTCEICQGTFDKKHKLTAHTKYVHPENLFACGEPNCDLKFKTDQQVTRHKNRIHKVGAGNSNQETETEK